MLSNSTSALVPFTVTANILYPLLSCFSVLSLNLSAISSPAELSAENVMELSVYTLSLILSEA